ncbi:hypothetical protein Sm713_40070 [Streptomyces sp. TS71-3]|nr:hypothetical protein Sm713_40070 [Streptomyces sp. TS71-3]
MGEVSGTCTALLRARAPHGAGLANPAAASAAVGAGVLISQSSAAAGFADKADFSDAGVLGNAGNQPAQYTREEKTPRRVRVPGGTEGLDLRIDSPRTKRL